MIEGFKPYKRLRRLYEADDPSGVNAEHLERLQLLLSALDAAGVVTDLAQPSFDLHQPARSPEGLLKAKPSPERVRRLPRPERLWHLRQPLLPRPPLPAIRLERSLWPYCLRACRCRLSQPA
jgi:hypothetical protein